ncbi:hypothetical protein [Terracoccus luteus]|uniref:hypothetical protein n=1 Tax=Terracoccus luteus TaxID=53356 RepID=UPI001473CFF8|nr:hypothetical protein [Terracoccus luteus]
MTRSNAARRSMRSASVRRRRAPAAAGRDGSDGGAVVPLALALQVLALQVLAP